MNLFIGMGDSVKPSVVRMRTSIDHLQVGMFVEDVFSGQGVLLLSEGKQIESTEQIENLKRRGVSQMVVNIPKSSHPETVAKFLNDNDAPTKEARRSERETAYYRELPMARETHAQAFESAKKMLVSVRGRDEISIRNVMDAAESIALSITRNPDALVSLTQIKGYDEYTYIHSVNVGILMASLAKEFGFKGDALIEFGMGGLLHDIGKMKVSEALLNKPGRLTDAEFAVLKRHPEYGLQLLESKKDIPDMARKAVGQHHERLNGTGYPLRLTGGRIHEAALICAVADVFDALTSDRVYHEAWTPQKALATIFQGCDLTFSRKYVERFTRHMGIYPVGSFVKLASGEMAVVIRVDPGQLLCPHVLILFDKEEKRYSNPISYRLASHEGSKEAASRKIILSLSPKPYGIQIADYLGKPL